MNRTPNPYQPPKENVDSPPVSNLAHQILLLLTTFAGVLAVCFSVFVAPFAWMLKDGLGPDSVDSTGWLAAHRMFWSLYWGPISCVLFSVFLALWFCVFKTKRYESEND